MTREVDFCESKKTEGESGCERVRAGATRDGVVTATIHLVYTLSQAGLVIFVQEYYKKI